MTFKTPSPSVYFGSLLIAAALTGLAYWILQTQNLTDNSLITLLVGLFIGHLIAACSQVSSAQTTTKTKPTTTTGASPSGDTISLYVGNLAYRAQRDDLRELFEHYGQVNSVRIMTDRATRRPRGYAFVEMESGAAQEAIKQLDNSEFCGRNLRVSEAKQRS